MKGSFGGMIKKEKWKRIIATVIFLLVITRVFIAVTYLFRNVGYNRDHVIGIKEEKALDMVYIGGSAAFVYWQPLKAWNDYGFTSYNLAVDTVQAESIEYLMKAALKYQNPKCFVIDARAFQYYAVEGSNVGLRNASDSLDFLSADRWKMIYEYTGHHDIGEEENKASFYLDIFKYHTKQSTEGTLGEREYWDRINNTGKAAWKGFEWILDHECLEKPEMFGTDIRAELLEEDLDALYSLLEFCQEKELNVLFVVCPYRIEKEHQEKYNTIEDIVASYGFDFLNANEYYEEMCIDFSTDFYNMDHVNCYGAEKYTAFLERYIDELYDMPDHRGKSEYVDWDEDFERFSLEEQKTKETIDGLIQAELE